jgi:cytochrome c oxidase subunit 2
VGTTAKIIAFSYLGLVVVGIVLAVILVRTTRTRREVDTERLAHRERAWLLVVIAIMTALLFGTIFFIPWARSADGDAQVVRVEAVQFGWTIEPGSVVAGEPVEFVLSSPDVNHGFGVYDERDRLVLQVQVVPGKEQHTIYTFERPGTYSVLCLEFCGVGHHVMRSQLTVEAA